MPAKKQPKKSSKDDTKQILMNAGITLFARNGYDGTSVKEIADEAKMNISLVSYHYGGKEGLYRACLDQFAQQRLAIVQRILVPASNKEEFKIRLQMFIEEFLVCFHDQPEISKMVQRECEKEVPIIDDIFQKSFLKIFETIVVFIATAQKKGILRKEIDPMIFTTGFMGSITHFSRVDSLSERYFKKSLKTPSYREKISEQLLGLTLKGVLK